MAPELRRERERSTLNLPELTHFNDGGEYITEMRRKVYNIVTSDPVFRQDDRYYHSTEEAFDRAMEKAVRYVQVCKEQGITNGIEKNIFANATGEQSPIGLHEGMFLPTIEGQGTEEQKAKWVPLSRDYKIIGAYAQTEMGHGTFVRGLETTATYDPSSQEFILNTPTLTATKWWPGTLGHTATHAIVLARLITRGKDHGIHVFIVQIRSLEDHTPLPGIKVGDIGPKFGYFGMDNGYLELNHVRIPRDQMLMKYAKVAPDGTYSKPPTDKITYGTMVQIRSGIVIMMAKCLARTITIATRYSVVRRQGESESGAREKQILDYQTQQFKLLPLIASTYAFTQAGIYMLRLHMQSMAEIAEGDFKSLPELHATSAGLKAFSADFCSKGMELCRLACGGHGYSQASGIPYIYVNYVSASTYEGENTVMLLQTARYLLKQFSQKLPMSKLSVNVAYLGSDFRVHKYCSVRLSEQFTEPHTQLEAYRQRARRMVAIATANYQQALGRGCSQSEAWNMSSIDWTVAATAHCHYVVLKAFHESVQLAGLSPSNRVAMETLCSLFAVFGIVEYAGEFAADGYMSAAQLSLARQQLYSLLKAVRREAVPLVDAFDIPDEILNSALGRYDGDVYKHLYEWALKAPRNKKKVHDVYHKYLRGLLKQPGSKL